MIFLKNIFFNWIEYELEQNNQTYLLTLDLGYPDINNLLIKHPQKVINLGVAEQNALLVACGLSQQGAKVFVYGISSFLLWRAAEIIKLYANSMDNVVIIGNGGGLGYGVMGESHHNVNDYGLLNLISPDIRCYFPLNAQTLIQQLNESRRIFKPQYFRLINPEPDFEKITTINTSIFTFQQFPTAEFTTVIVGPTYFAKKNKNSDIFYIMQWPCDLNLILNSAKKSKHLKVIEEHQEAGSISSYFYQYLNNTVTIETYCIEKNINKVGSRNYLIEHYVYNPSFNI